MAPERRVTVFELWGGVFFVFFPACPQFRNLMQSHLRPYWEKFALVKPQMLALGQMGLFALLDLVKNRTTGCASKLFVLRQYGERKEGNTFPMPDMRGFRDLFRSEDLEVMKPSDISSLVKGPWGVFFIDLCVFY